MSFLRGIRQNSFLAIDFPAVADFKHENRDHLILKLADQAIIPNPVPEQPLHFAHERLAE
jgi:hypothetical protein